MSQRTRCSPRGTLSSLGAGRVRLGAPAAGGGGVARCPWRPARSRSPAWGAARVTCSERGPWAGAAHITIRDEDEHMRRAWTVVTELAHGLGERSSPGGGSYQCRSDVAQCSSGHARRCGAALRRGADGRRGDAARSTQDVATAPRADSMAGGEAGGLRAGSRPARWRPTARATRPAGKPQQLPAPLQASARASDNRSSVACEHQKAQRHHEAPQQVAGRGSPSPRIVSVE